MGVALAPSRNTSGSLRLTLLLPGYTDVDSQVVDTDERERERERENKKKKNRSPLLSKAGLF